MANIPTFDASGYSGLTQPEVLENLKESVFNSGALGPEVSTGDHTILGMHLEANSIELSFLYDLVGDIVASGDVNAAEGVQQDNLNQLRGAIRNPARFSTSVVTCTGTPATPIAAGKIVSIGADGERWIIDEDTIIGGGGTVSAAVTAENAGAVEAAIGAINTIQTAVSGWTAVSNPAIAVLGEAIETDPDYRTRSENTTTGSTTEEAIFTRLSELDDVDAVSVVSNRETDPVDAFGTPIHFQWIVIYPDTADQQAIAEAIWGDAGEAGGIGFRGAVTATVTDANDFAQQIKWDWATAVDLWCSVTGTKDADYPAGGDTLVEDAITDYFATVRVGQDVYPTKVSEAVISAVPGIKTLIVLMKIGGAPGGGDIGAVTIAINQYADLNATIVVSIV